VEGMRSQDGNRSRVVLARARWFACYRSRRCSWASAAVRFPMLSYSCARPGSTANRC